MSPYPPQGTAPKLRFYPPQGIGAPAPPVPAGVIAIWSGLLADIPTNWSLCDGTGGTPNLIARFLRGAPAATEPGTTGGADSHTHASQTASGSHTHGIYDQNHSHTVNAAGFHGHGGPTHAVGTVSAMGVFTGRHAHTTDTQSHAHIVGDSGNHTHTISSSDGRPPYYEVAFIQARDGAGVAANLIIIWTGLLANIPTGWSLCDGGGGRPDLRSRFVRGINTNVTNPGTTGGAATHTHTLNTISHTHSISTMGAHSHAFFAYTWTHTHVNDLEAGGYGNYVQTDSGAGNHTHASTDTTGNHNHTGATGSLDHTHTVNSASSLPSYYDVAYIINDGGASVIPQNGVLIWAGLLANIPTGYNLCDGAGGRPDLRGRFIRGSDAGINPGGTGGSDTHTHTDQNDSAHSGHTIYTDGEHQHAATNTIGSHTHAVSTTANLSQVHDMGMRMANTTGGDHSHTFNSENSHTHTLGLAAGHNHNPWSTDDGRPAYYEVAFIQKA